MSEIDQEMSKIQEDDALSEEYNNLAGKYNNLLEDAGGLDNLLVQVKNNIESAEQCLENLENNVDITKKLEKKYKDERQKEQSRDIEKENLEDKILLLRSRALLKKCNITDNVHKLGNIREKLTKELNKVTPENIPIIIALKTKK